MAGRFPPTALISIGIVIINLMAWVLLLGGASGLQHDATAVVTVLNTVNAGGFESAGLPAGILAFGDLFPQSTPSNFISYEWFKAVFQVLTLLATLGVLATGQIHRFRIALVGLFAALAVLFSNASSTFYYLFLQTKGQPTSAVPTKIKREIQVYWSGCLISAALNYLLVITLGISEGVTARHNTATGPITKDTTNGAAAV